MTKISPGRHKMTTREQQEIKRIARWKTAGYIRSALEMGHCVESLMQGGLDEETALLVEKELLQLAMRLES